MTNGLLVGSSLIIGDDGQLEYREYINYMAVDQYQQYQEWVGEHPNKNWCGNL